MNSSVNKTIRTIFHTVLLAVFFSMTALAEEGLIYFSDPSVNTGDTVDVTMTIQSDNTKIGDVNVLLKYPSDSLEFKKGTSASGGAGTIRVHGKGTKDGDHKMTYVLSFKALTPGEFTVNIDSSEVYDENGAAITISHMGSSKITVEGNGTPSGNAVLSSLEVSPGSLNPAFSPEVTSYSVTVGLSVDHLTINALPADSSSSVSVVNNENLKEGENNVIVYVQTGDGLLQTEYHINVLKTEGGEENIPASEEASSVETTDGIQLSCKGKTITIMETGDEVASPEGYRESQVKIDGNPVKGWILDEESQPEYFLVYGMNDQGELNYYRYDLSERTIQRYFTDSKSDDFTNSEEYLLMIETLEESESKRSTLKMILMILSVAALLMLAVLIWISVRLSSVTKELELVREDRMNGIVNSRLDPEKSNRTRSSRRLEQLRDSYDDEDEDGENDDTDTDAYDDMDCSEADATKVMPSARRRTSRKAFSVPEETTVIRRTSRRRRDTGSDPEDI